MSKNLKIRLDQILVDRKLVDTKNRAQSIIMAGQVLVNDKLITKSGNSFRNDCKIIIKNLHPKDPPIHNLHPALQAHECHYARGSGPANLC